MAKLYQVGPNRAKHLPKGVKQGQTWLKKLKWGLDIVTRGKLAGKVSRGHKTVKRLLVSGL